LLDALGAGDDAGTRNSAAEALARIGSPALHPLLDRLQDPDADIRKFAIDVLGEIKNRRAVPGLAARLADPDPNVRAAAAEAMGNQRRGKPFPALEPLVRAVRAVARDPAVAAACVAALRSDDAMVAEGALAALGWIGDATHAPAIAQAAEDERLRPSAVEALAA